MDGLAVLPPENQNKRPQPRRIDILAPTPRRHLIDTSQSQHWLVSPGTSSPYSTTFPGSPDRSPSPTAHRKYPESPSTTRHRFAAIYHQQPHGSSQGLRNRQASNASIASTYTAHGGSFMSSSSSNLHKTLLRNRKLGSQAHLDATESVSIGRRWIRYMHQRGLRNWVVPSAIAFATLLKLCLGLASYSGISSHYLSR